MLLGAILLESGSLERDLAEGVHEDPSPITYVQLASDSPLENRHVVVEDLVVCQKGHSEQKLNAVISHAPAYSALADSEPAADRMRLIVTTWSNAGEAGPYLPISSGPLVGFVDDGRLKISASARERLFECYPGIDIDKCRLLVVGKPVPTLFRAKVITWGGRGILTGSCVASFCSIWVIRRCRRYQAKQDTGNIAMRPAIDQSF
jgi:hypothetical protein